MRVVTALEMRKIEELAGSMGISPLILMENAAIAVSTVVLNHLKGQEKKIVTVLSGRGNNGGDGLAVARHLYNKGLTVRVVLAAGERKLSFETEKNLNIVKALGIDLYETSELDNKLVEMIKSTDIIIDALLGTGLSRQVEGFYRELITFVNSLHKTVFSVDIPSGVDADRGDILGAAIKADFTIALGLYKPGHLLFPGRLYCGKVILVDISLSCKEIKEEGVLNKVEEKEVKSFFKKRRLDGHKGTYGHLAIIGGSSGKTGAVAMSGKAAMRAGTGLVTVVCPYSLKNEICASQLELMTLPVADINGYISFAAIDVVRDFLKNKNAVVIGPGLGAKEITAEFFFDLFDDIESPLLIDADGINLLAKDREILKKKKGEVVLTPHIGEMARLLNLSNRDVLKDPLYYAKEFAIKENVHIVLKSATTIYATPEGIVYLSTYGNPGMATAGSGDVLSGIIGSFLAQGYGMKEAILLSLTVHGLSGELAAKKYGETSLVATDIIAAIPEVLKNWEV